MQNTCDDKLEEMNSYVVGVLADSAADSAIIDINVAGVDVDITLIPVRAHHVEQVMVPLRLGQSTRFDSFTFSITSNLSRNTVSKGVTGATCRTSCLK